MMIKYSVVVPVFNSEDTLESLYDKTHEFFFSKGFDFEMVFVDDYSTDNSWRNIVSLHERHKNVQGIKLNKNAGQHHATSCGIKHALGDFIITIDDDLQVYPEEIDKLISTQYSTAADVVYGIYIKKKHSPLRNMGSILFGKIFKKYAETISKGSSFKLMKAEIARKSASHNIRHLYLDEIINWYTGNIATVDVEHHPRQHGKSGYNIFSLVFISLNYIVNYTVLPLKMMTYFGLISSIISAGFGLYFLFNKVFFGAALGFTAIIVAIFFSTSILLFCFGIIGEYIRRLFDMNQNKPIYHVDIHLK
ncbi:MAG: glycosyltransferase family 2 protein [Bacteroidales bacterium]|nr:glycosyltransferase family 2 protein [Bacteroidales bacterium]